MAGGQILLPNGTVSAPLPGSQTAANVYGYAGLPPAGSASGGQYPSTQDIFPSSSRVDRTAILGPSLASPNTWEQSTAQEPNSFFANGFYHLIYTGTNGANGSLGYAYAVTPTGPWIKPNANPVIGNGFGGTTAGQYVQHTGLYIEGSTIYIISSVSPNNGGVLLFAAPLNFDILIGPVFALLGTIIPALPTNYNAWGNFAIIPGGAGNTYAMLVEIRLTATAVYTQALYISNGASISTAPSFTLNTLNITSLNTLITYWNAAQPADDNGGAWVAIEGSTVIQYYHAGPLGTSPVQMFRATSPINDLINWTSIDNGLPIMRAKHQFEVDQVGDPSPVMGPAGDWWMFSTAANGLSGVSYIIVTPCYRSSQTISNGVKTYLSKPDDQFDTIGFNAKTYLSIVVTSFTAVNHDDIVYNNGINDLTITAPRASSESFFRVSNRNSTGHIVTVTINASDRFGYASVNGGSCVVHAGEVVTFHAVGNNAWSLSRPPIGTPATGAQTATFVATNKPGTGTNGPTNWLPITFEGTTYYIPLFGA